MENDLWTVLEGEYDGHPLIVRYRQLASDFDRASYPYRLNLFWQMATPDPNGLPSGREAGFLELFEERLFQALDPDDHSIVSVILTCNGKREFVLHTRDPELFLQELTQMPHEEEPYPIEIHCYEDADWEYDDSVTQAE